VAKNRAGKNEGIFHYVIENKWWKNARNRPFPYVDGKKGSYRQLSIILMKKQGVTKDAAMNDELRSQQPDAPGERQSPRSSSKAGQFRSSVNRRMKPTRIDRKDIDRVGSKMRPQRFPRVSPVAINFGPSRAGTLSRL